MASWKTWCNSPPSKVRLDPPMWLNTSVSSLTNLKNSDFKTYLLLSFPLLYIYSFSPLEMLVESQSTTCDSVRIYPVPFFVFPSTHSLLKVENASRPFSSSRVFGLICNKWLMSLERHFYGSPDIIRMSFLTRFKWDDFGISSRSYLFWPDVLWIDGRSCFSLYKTSFCFLYCELSYFKYYRSWVSLWQYMYLFVLLI